MRSTSHCTMLVNHACCGYFDIENLFTVDRRNHIILYEKYRGYIQVIEIIIIQC